MRKICVVTATRAEYGLLKPLISELKNSESYKLQLLVTGAHLSPEFGYTLDFIEQDDFKIDEKIEMLLSADTGTSIVKTMGLGMIGFADALNRLSPDAIVILGDRYEMLSMALAAAVMKIPIIHLHGGEITEGAYDDAFRHAITKLAHLHFTSTESHRNRVIQLGECPQNVFNVGAIGIDNILEINFVDKDQLGKELDIDWKPFIYQVTFHPETLSTSSAKDQFQELLRAIDSIEKSFFVFTKANADTDGRIINKMIDSYTAKNPHKAKSFISLGTVNFLSLLKISNGIIGNSSSGIIEAPVFKIPTINIGNRQKGRIQTTSVLNCKAKEEEITKAILLTQDLEYIKLLQNVENPYGTGNTAKRIIQVLDDINFDSLLVKRFYDLNTLVNEQPF